MSVVDARALRLAARLCAYGFAIGSAIGLIVGIVQLWTGERHGCTG